MSMRFFKWLSLLVWSMAMMTPAQAALEIVITEGMDDARPVAIVPFQWNGSTVAPPQDMADIIARDLERSGRFRPMAVADMPERPFVAGQVNLAAWRGKGIEAVVVGKISETAPGQFQIGFELIDVFKGRDKSATAMGSSAVIEARQHLVPSAGVRMHAHKMADIIYEKLTGERGAFATHIAYVNIDRSDRLPYKLFVADSDDYNPRVIASSTEPLMSPAWAKDGRRLAYVSFEKGRSQLFVQDIYTGQRQVVAAFPGHNGAPAWSPDGSKLAMSLSHEGNPEIYVYDVATRQSRRVTTTGIGIIDTDPTWSPDGQYIAFTSDRGGKPQVYRVHLASGQIQRVTFEGDYNSEPEYSPDGKKMVMINRTAGQFRVGIQDLASGSLQVLTDTQLDQSPSLAPNGSMVIYATLHRGQQVLAVVSTDGRFKARLQARKGEVRAPAWSPFLD